MILKNLITVLLHFGIAIGLIIISGHWVLGLYFYLFIIFLFFRMIPRKHVKGIQHLYNNEFDKAYNDFEKSYKLFDKYKFIDKFGFIFLLSMSDYTYRESALLNQAFICNKIGNKKEAEKLYEKILSINPKNRIARKVIESKK
ncbi:tetratricopeptide repeat protein [Winogradskyella sp.]|uniref:tetratricopeptide repeat protein n=1 Tax=Winogradskyella sp. TaxID=1883156 RepID=UPI003AB7D5B8